MKPLLINIIILLLFLILYIPAPTRAVNVDPTPIIRNTIVNIWSVLTIKTTVALLSLRLLFLLQNQFLSNPASFLFIDFNFICYISKVFSTILPCKGYNGLLRLDLILAPFYLKNLTHFKCP